MSIAVSAVISPSRLLRAAVFSYGAANLGVGLALAAGLCGPVLLAPWLAGFCLLAGAVLLHAAAAAGKTRRIDISGVGQIRLTVQLDIRTTLMRPELVHLMPGSTVWPQMLVLRMRGEAGAVSFLAVLSDSVESGQFRALAVAIRSIAGQNNEFFGNNKIL